MMNESKNKNIATTTTATPHSPLFTKIIAAREDAGISSPPTSALTPEQKSIAEELRNPDVPSGTKIKTGDEVWVKA